MPMDDPQNHPYSSLAPEERNLRRAQRFESIVAQSDRFSVISVPSFHPIPEEICNVRVYSIIQQFCPGDCGHPAIDLAIDGIRDELDMAVGETEDGAPRMLASEGAVLSIHGTSRAGLRVQWIRRRAKAVGVHECIGPRIR